MYIDKSNSYLTNNMVFLMDDWFFHSRPQDMGDCLSFLQYLGNEDSEYGREFPIMYRFEYAESNFSDHNHWFDTGYEVKPLLSFVSDITKLRPRQIKRAQKALRRKEARKNG